MEETDRISSLLLEVEDVEEVGYAPSEN